MTEFWMVEPETAYQDLDGLMEMEEQFIGYIVAQCLEHCRPELEILERDLSILERITPPFPRISYDQAVEKLAEIRAETSDPELNTLLELEWGSDFGAPHETALTKLYDRPLFVYGYPTVCKAFYMEPWPNRPEVCKSVDLLAPEGYGEITGGSQRIANPELIRQKIEHDNLPPEAFKWYMELRQFGSVPHSGFGLGVERTVAWICGIHHIRETNPFPRTLGRVYP
jgi:asparaginyl-tRNA synthetase